MGSTILNQLVQAFQANAASWQAVLKADALDLFWLLVAIDFVFTAIRLVFRGADFSEWLGEVVQQRGPPRLWTRCARPRTRPAPPVAVRLT